MDFVSFNFPPGKIGSIREAEQINIFLDPDDNEIIKQTDEKGNLVSKFKIVDHESMNFEIFVDEFKKQSSIITKIPEQFFVEEVLDLTQEEIKNKFYEKNNRVEL